VQNCFFVNKIILNILILKVRMWRLFCMSLAQIQFPHSRIDSASRQFENLFQRNISHSCLYKYLSQGRGDKELKRVRRDQNPTGAICHAFVAPLRMLLYICLTSCGLPSRDRTRSKLNKHSPLVAASRLRLQLRKLK